MHACFCLAVAGGVKQRAVNAEKCYRVDRAVYRRPSC